MQSPFTSAWWSFDLGEFRPCDGTYERYDYASVPPLDESRFRGAFQWLTPAPTRRAARPAAFLAAAEKQGVALPAAVVEFFSRPGLAAAIPSCTACEWDPSPAPIACPIVPGAWLVRVLRDQQDCLFWYLHLHPDGDAHVLCSPIPFDEPDARKLPREVILANTWYCAPHFEHFAYRFWLENEIWDRAGGQGATWTPEERDYLAHYRPDLAANLTVQAPAPPDAPTPAQETAAAPATPNKKAAKKKAAKKKAAKKKAAKKTSAKKPAKKKTAAKKATKKTSAKKATKKTSAKKTAKKATKKTAKKAATKKTAARARQ